MMTWLLIIMVYIVSYFLCKKMALNSISYRGPIDDRDKSFVRAWSFLGPVGVILLLLMERKKCFKEKQWKK